MFSHAFIRATALRRNLRLYRSFHFRSTLPLLSPRVCLGKQLFRTQRGKGTQVSMGRAENTVASALKHSGVLARGSAFLGQAAFGVGEGGSGSVT